MLAKLPRLDPQRFTLAVALSLMAATALLALGVERLARGATGLGYALVLVGLAATTVAFALRVEGLDDGPPPALLLITRDDCALCDQARGILHHVQGQPGARFAVWEANVDQDPALARLHGDEVPVIYADGQPIATLGISEEEVRAAVGLSRGSSGSGGSGGSGGSRDRDPSSPASPSSRSSTRGSSTREAP